MVDNITAKANTGAGTEVLAADDIGGVLFSRVKVVLGADGFNDGDVSGANPMPVAGPMTDAQARATPLPVSLATLPATVNNIGDVGTRDLASSTFNQAGVIVINTVLMTVDCTKLRGLAVQAIAVGTTGVITPQWSNDNTNWVAASLMTPAGVAAATLTGAGLWTTVIFARYFRLILTTATTAGSTTLDVKGSSMPIGQPVVQPVSGSVAVSGSLTSGGTVTTTPTTPTASFVNSAASTNATVVKAGAGTLHGIVASNMGASIRYLKLHNATSVTVGTTAVALTIPIPIGGFVQIDWGAIGMRFGTGLCLSITGAAGDADATAIGASEVKVAVSFL